MNVADADFVRQLVKGAEDAIMDGERAGRDAARRLQELNEFSRSARSAIAVRRNPDPAEVSPMRRDGGKPAPTETGAFIDFYSGVLGVDRAQLTLKR